MRTGSGSASQVVSASGTNECINLNFPHDRPEDLELLPETDTTHAAAFALVATTDIGRRYRGK